MHGHRGALWALAMGLPLMGGEPGSRPLTRGPTHPGIKAGVEGAAQPAHWPPWVTPQVGETSGETDTPVLSGGQLRSGEGRHCGWDPMGALRGPPQAGTCICPTPHIPRSSQQVCGGKRTQMPGTRALAPGAVWGNQALEGRCSRVMGVQM